MRSKPRIIHIACVRGSCCLRGKPRRKGGRLIEFFMDRVVILFAFIFCLTGVVALLIVEDDLRRRFRYFELRADFLDLRCLLFETGREGLNFLLLLRGS